MLDQWVVERGSYLSSNTTLTVTRLEKNNAASLFVNSVKNNLKIRIILQYFIIKYLNKLQVVYGQRSEISPDPGLRSSGSIGIT